MLKDKNTTVGSLGIIIGLTLILTFLKVANIGTVTTWNWVLVLAPLWIPIIMSSTIVIIVYVFLWFNSKK